ncbi:MAG: alpha-amylase family glycosyl hydrolase [Pseudomonadota bacterium]
MSEWWKGAVVYQVYPRSFYDQRGDGIGDLPGITDKLDYIANLGVDAIWMCPFFRSPMKDFGYDVCDFTDVDPQFGSIADFDVLVERAHERGLKVIIDQVNSHCSDQMPWFVESRSSRDNAKADWFIWKDAKPDGSPPNNWQSIFGGPSWTWDTRRRQYYLHNFLASQPDLNIRNTEVQDALIDVARFWLNRGVDGLRLDAVNFYTCDPEFSDNPPNEDQSAVKPYYMQLHEKDINHPDTLAFLRRLRAELDEKPGRFAVAEVFEENPTGRSVDYTNAPDLIHTAYNFSYLYLDGKVTAEELRVPIRIWEEGGKGAWPSWAFSNHDTPRVITRWRGATANESHATLFLGLLIALRGTIFLYQGEELGLPQSDVAFEFLQDPEAITNWPETLGRDGCRTPMPWRANAPFAGFSTSDPWLPVPAAHAERAIDLQEAATGSVLSHARKMLALRKDRLALREGALELLDVDEPFLAFIRRHDSGDILVVLNISDQSAHLPISGTTVVKPLFLTQGVEIGSEQITCPPNAVAWLELG